MANLAELRVIVFQDSGLYVAQCLDHDIGSQAKTIAEAVSQLELTIEAELAMRGTTSLDDIPKASPYYLDLWSAASLKIDRVKVSMDNCLPSLNIHLAQAA